MTLIHAGVAQAGASKSITLAASASEVADFYKYRVVKIVGGLGAGQVRNVVGSRKNLQARSENFSTSSYGKYNVAAGDFETIVEVNGVIATKEAVCTVAPVIGLQRTVQFRVKANGRNYLRANPASGVVSGTPYTVINVATGSIISQGPAITVSATLAEDGYVDVAITYIPIATTAQFYLTLLNDAFQTGYLGDGVSGVKLTKVMFSNGGPSEYIHTEANPAVGAIIDTAWDTIPDATSQYEIHEYLIAAMAFALKKRSATMTFSARRASFALTKRTATFRKVP